jgi:hypothetical protein
MNAARVLVYFCNSGILGIGRQRLIVTLRNAVCAGHDSNAMNSKTELWQINMTHLGNTHTAVASPILVA